MKYLCLVALFLLCCLPAVADSAAFDINISNGAVTPPAASYGTIGLFLNADHTITITVTMAPGYLIGGGNGATALGFNYAAGVTGSLVSLGSTLPSGYAFNCCNAGQVNGFGSFLGNLTGPNASQSLSTLMFTLSTTQQFAGANYTGFTSVYQLVAFSTGGAGDGNQDFAVHVVPTASGGRTGYAGSSTQVSVPEHGSAVLLLATVGCLGSLWFSKIRGSQLRH